VSSSYIKYDPKKFALLRTTAVASTLDEFLVGASKLNAPNTVRTPIEAATFSVTSGYTPDATGLPNIKPVVPPGTLLVDAETAAISLSFWDEPGELLYPGDRIEAMYQGAAVFRGVVDSTSLTYVADPAAYKHGASRRVDFSATAAGLYAVMMTRTVKWSKLPAETPIKRIRRWVTVNNWTD
jgi:hypothetical protein